MLCTVALIACEPNEEVVQSTQCTTPYFTFNESDFDNVYDGIELTETTTLEGASWNNTLIKNCHVHDTAGDGIVLRDVQNVVITGCVFENIGGTGGQAAVRGSISGDTKDVFLYNNVIRNTARNGLAFGQRAANGVDHENLRIIANTITNTGLGSSDGSTHGLYIQAQDYEIAHNTVSGERDGNGISVRSSGEVVCNMVTGNSKTDKPGIRYYSDHQTGSSNTLLFDQNEVSGQSIGIDLYQPVNRYDGKTGYDHVVKTFSFVDNVLIGNGEAIRIANEYNSAPFKVIGQ
jgi:hypothetical protein